MARHDKHIPTAETRKTALDLVSNGVPQARIADYLGICEDTFRTHYKREIAIGRCEPTALVGKTLIDMAVTERDVKAMIFYLSTQGGWRKADAEADKEAKSIVEQLIAKL